MPERMRSGKYQCFHQQLYLAIVFLIYPSLRRNKIPVGCRHIHDSLCASLALAFGVCARKGGVDLSHCY